MLKGHLDPLLLAVLADGPAHGYSVIERLRLKSLGEFSLPEGTVYPALHRLEESGLLVSRWERVQGRRRRVYSLSDKGLKALGQARERWRGFSRGVAAVLGRTA
jgi:DNA-binding PadR family transcriptional regulator